MPSYGTDFFFLCLVSLLISMVFALFAIIFCFFKCNTVTCFSISSRFFKCKLIGLLMCECKYFRLEKKKLPEKHIMIYETGDFSGYFVYTY